jgi:hypothetical protein
VENHVYLSRIVQVAGVAWRAAMRIMAGVGYLVQMIENGHICRVLGDRTVERSGDVVCGLHRTSEDEEREFLG